MPPTTPKNKSYPRNSGITPADQFNILLLHTSTSDDLTPDEVGVFSGATDDHLNMTTPLVTVTPVLDDVPCRYEVGKLYQVAASHVVFFSAEQINKSWPEEWFAKDVYAGEGEVLMFLGVVRYDLINTKSQAARSMFALKFVYAETIVQYPIMRLMTIDPLGYPEVGEGLIDPRKKEEEQRAYNSLMHALSDELVLVKT